MIEYDLFPKGKQFALTMSFDDGSYDERLVEIFDRYGIKGTFHLNSKNMQKLGLFDNIAKVYQNHEVACHGSLHRTMPYIPTQCLVEEIFEDRKALERAVGYTVTGLSYACGGYTREHAAILRGLGIQYSRTTRNTMNYMIPEDFMEWHPTCHYCDAMQMGKKLLDGMDGWIGYPKLLYVWGHAHELERNEHWEMMEDFCRMMGRNDRIWYATNMEIYRYITAQRSLVISADESIVYNPSALDVWFSRDGEAYCVRAGKILRF